MKNFEDKLNRLEELSDKIKNPEIRLEEALKVFEEGILLAKNMEKELDKIEGKVEILMNQPEPKKGEKPELDLFGDLELS